MAPARVDLTPRFVAGLLTHYAATVKHKLWVAWFLLQWCMRNGDWWEFGRRALVHDLSKFRWDEASAFATTIFDLRTTEYGTPEYRALLDRIYPSIMAHYARNRHHPEYWIGGFHDMSAHDRIEMVADWAAASKRGVNGDVERSITKNADRFLYGDVERLALIAVAQEMGAL